MLESMTFDRFVTAAVLASLAVAVAFGPELRRKIARLRNRRIADEVPAALGAEPQQS